MTEIENKTHNLNIFFKKYFLFKSDGLKFTYLKESWNLILRN